MYTVIPVFSNDSLEILKCECIKYSLCISLDLFSCVKCVFDHKFHLSQVLVVSPLNINKNDQDDMVWIFIHFFSAVVNLSTIITMSVVKIHKCKFMIHHWLWYCKWSWGCFWHVWVLYGQQCDVHSVHCWTVLAQKCILCSNHLRKYVEMYHMTSLLSHKHVLFPYSLPR